MDALLFVAFVWLTARASTTDIFCNKNLLTDIHESGSVTHIISNGGTLKITKKGTLDGYGLVWYHPKAITNILSLSNVTNRIPISYDSRNGEVFIMHKPEGDRYFTQISAGLYRFDTRDEANYAFLTTSASVRERFSRREYENAKKARDMHAMVGYPSDGDYKKMIKHGLIHNCDITIQDVSNAHEIFGKSIFELKGKQPGCMRIR